MFGLRNFPNFFPKRYRARRRKIHATLNEPLKELRWEKQPN